MKAKFYVVKEEIAMAVFHPAQNPSFGLYYLAKIEIFLKAGGRVEVNTDHSCWDTVYSMLEFDQEEP